MKVILISRKHGGSRSIELSRWSRALLSLCCLGLPLGLAASGYLAGQESGGRGAALDTLQDEQQQAGETGDLAGATESKVQAMTINLAELEARMTRLDALGQHLTSMADLEQGEFDFSQPAALGGPLIGESTDEFTTNGLEGALDRFEERLSDREQQLDILESMLTNRKLEEQGALSGQPVKKGYVSSGYGWRRDPINGKQALHSGLDFAGKSGSDVVAVASGVVTFSGRDSGGYGNLVEISHGDDYVTRYAHNKETLVHPGDVVRKGDTIALMGSTGRSTGSHVHFEVFKNGRSVDPSSYVARTHP
jgi:murein DD-endopeptidase MepM/ murein hydrolase activator NlpD